MQDPSSGANAILQDVIYTCRTCLGLGTSKKVSTILSFCVDIANGRNVKYIDVLLKMVPQMASTVSHSDRICTRCRKVLTQIHEFSVQCLDVEEQLKESQQQSSLLVQSDSKSDVGCEIQENVDNILWEGPEYRVEDGSKANETIVIDNSDDDESPMAAVEWDHSYLKSAKKSNIKKKPPVKNVPKQKIEKKDSSKESERFICEQCGKVYLQKSSLRLHQLTHTEQETKCPDCPKVFSCKLYMQKHRRTHLPVTQRPYMCSQCGLQFHHKETMNKHVMLTHLRIKPYQCDLCNKTFGRKDYLKRHKERHEKAMQPLPKRIPKGPKAWKYKNLRAKLTDGMLPCKICGKSFMGFDKLKTHLGRHALGKRYACSYCPLTYKFFTTVKNHEKWHMQEDGIRHRCNICWRRFTDRAELETHMQRHSNPRYECHVCFERFHRKYLLDNHVLLEHATPEDLEISQQQVVYETLKEMAEQSMEMRDEKLLET